MRNQHKGVCYRCGQDVQPGAGHFERVTKPQLAKWPALRTQHVKWLLQHSDCTIKYRGTDTHFQYKPEASDATTS